MLFSSSILVIVNVKSLSPSISVALKLIDKLESYRKEFEGKSVPRPSFWTGFRVLPSVIEFWDKKPSRLHERFLYSLSADGEWICDILNP